MLALPLLLAAAGVGSTNSCTPLTAAARAMRSKQSAVKDRKRLSATRRCSVERTDGRFWVGPEDSVLSPRRRTRFSSCASFLLFSRARDLLFCRSLF